VRTKTPSTNGRRNTPEPSITAEKDDAMPAGSPQDCTAEFTSALIRRDIDAALALLTDDVVFFYSNGSAIRGKAAFASLMTASWQIVKDYKYTTLEAAWAVETDTSASVIYAFEWSGKAGENPVSGGGRGTRVLLKTADRGWLIAHEHLSNGQW
jgi:ketosteroid isomerase-like protein